VYHVETCSVVLVEDLLPSSLRPFAHKPGFVCLLEPILNGNSNSLRRYSSIKHIRIVEWKYSTNSYLSHTAKLIPNKYAPLANARRHRWLSIGVDILPIVISRTGTPHIYMIVSRTSLITLRTDPRDKMIAKARLETTRILS
jgi:hypothetical protein